MLILPINDKGRLSHLCRSDLRLDTKEEKLAEKREDIVLVTFTPRYLKPEGLILKEISDCVNCSPN